MGHYYPIFGRFEDTATLLALLHGISVWFSPRRCYCLTFAATAAPGAAIIQIFNLGPLRLDSALYPPESNLRWTIFFLRRKKASEAKD